MKTILAGLLAILLAGLTLESGIASRTPPSAADATMRTALADDYDNPVFGSPGWWDRQGDHG